MLWTWTENAPQPGDALQVDDRGVPLWVPTTNVITPFHGAPKTPGFPHYLDGLPMSVVSQLGYVDRGIGKRGIFSVVDDFILPPTSVSGAFDGNWGAYRAVTAGVESGIGGEGYLSGSARLAAGRADTHDRALLYQEIPPFNYVPGRRLWCSTRPSLRKPADNSFPTTGSALVGIVRLVDRDGFLDAWPEGAAHSASGMFFLKKQGETDWSFYVALSADDGPPAVVTLANVVTAGLGHAPNAGQYVPLSFQIDATGACIVYVDGNVVGTVPATNPIWATFAPTAFGHDELYGDFGFVAAVESGTATEGCILNLDQMLVAEETQADPD